MRVETKFIFDAGRETHTSSRIRVDPDATILLKGRFRSRGVTDSRLYFGLICYRKDGTVITSPQNFRINESFVIMDVVIEADGRTSFHLSGTPSQWFANDTCGYRRGFGIYLDGDVGHVPDIFHHSADNENGPTSGAFFLDGSRLVLNKPLSQEELSQVQQHVKKAVVMNHYSTSTHHYGAASDVVVPREWTTYSIIYRGESFNDARGKFRMDTDSIEMLLIASQDAQGILEVKDLELTSTLSARIDFHP